PNGKLLTKPGKEAMRRIRERLSDEATALRGANADAFIARLNPVITGWAAYYRIGVSKHAYGTLDAHLWRLAWKWAKFSHPNKPIRQPAIDSVTDLGTPDGRAAYHLIHAHCRNRIGNGTSPALLPGLQP